MMKVLGLLKTEESTRDNFVTLKLKKSLRIALHGAKL